jgi:cardiolipin synthase (CMP-forming)
MGKGGVSMQLKHLPNIITCLRILFIIPLLATISMRHFELAFYLLVIAGISDGLDGFLARHFNWRSQFGSIADPMADKLLLVGTLIVLGTLGEIPWWLITVIIGKDIWVSVGALTYYCVLGPFDIIPNFAGKCSTVFQLMLIGAILLGLGIYPMPQLLIQILMGLVLLTCVLSFVEYTWIWAKRASRLLSSPFA